MNYFLRLMNNIFRTLVGRQCSDKDATVEHDEEEEQHDDRDQIMQGKT